MGNLPINELLEPLLYDSGSRLPLFFWETIRSLNSRVFKLTSTAIVNEKLLRVKFSSQRFENKEITFYLLLYAAF